MKKITRRQFLKNVSVAGTTAVGAATVSGLTTPFLKKAWGGNTKTLNYAASEPLTGSWDPFTHTILSQVIHEQMTHAPLFRATQKSENPSELIPDMALSQKLIDPYTLEFALRRGVKFHDGQDFTAEDAKATLEWATRAEAGRSVMFPGKIDAEIVDKYTVRINTKKYNYPAANWWFQGTYLSQLSAKDIADGKIASRPNGTGPFKHVERKGDKSILEANPEYYGGKPPIDKIIYHIMTDAPTREIALRTGEVQMIERLEPQQVESLTGKSGIEIIKTPSAENKWLVFRCNKEPFNNWKIRRAACHAIDRKAILDIMGEAGQFAGAHITPAAFGYKAMKNMPEYDPNKCQKLLSEAGYPKGKGLPELEYFTSVGFYPMTKEYGEVITAMMQEQGFKIKFSALEVSSWLEKLYKKEVGHLCDTGWSIGSPEPDITIRLNFRSGLSLLCDVKDSDIDAALDRERNETDLTKRLKLLETETLPILAERVPMFPLFRSVLIHAKVANLKNFYIAPDGRLWLEKANFV